MELAEHSRQEHHHERRRDAEWLQLVRTAAGVADLKQNALTIKDGVLTALKICDTNLPKNHLQLLTDLGLPINILASLPESFGQLTSLTQLDLHNNRLSSLPESIGRLTLLTSLNVTSNQLTSLPESIGKLTSVTLLELHNNQFASLPKSFGQLTKLTNLDIKNSHLTFFSESIGELTGLTSLVLHNNSFATIHTSIGNLRSLERLDLNNNEIISLPESIGQLTSLVILNLDDNHMTSLPESIGHLTSLTSLNFHNNHLTSLPESIGRLSSLEVISLYSNKLAYLPESIGQLTKLTTLDLTHNKLAYLPESIGQLTSLKSLNLGNNELASLPESIGRLSNLTYLNLYNNPLTSLPKNIGQLASLIELDLFKTRLASLPDSIGQLTSLMRLHLRWNRLASLPESIGQLTKLTKLDLSQNKLLGEVPQWLGHLVSLTELDLSGNADLGGSLPSMTCPNIKFGATKVISSVKIKMKPVKKLSDWLFIVTHVLMGYADLATDVLSIIEFGKDGSAALMWLNIGFLLFNLCVDVALMPHAWGKVLALLQVQQVVQAYESLSKGRQTANFVRSKKVDAICRSMPSIVLQLYGLLATLPSLGNTGPVTISLSVAFGVICSGMTLGSLAPKSGDSLFSYAFRVHFYYYVCELTVRLLSISLLFLSIGIIGSPAILALDFLMSDAIDGPCQRSLRVWSSFSSIVLLLALCLINLLNTPTLAAFRVAYGDAPLYFVTTLACVAQFFKYTVGNYIEETKFSHEEAQDEKQQHNEHKRAVALPPLSRRASQIVSLDATYDGSQVDHIPPSRLHAQHAGPGSVSLAAGRGSTGAMTDNPLRPGTGGGAAPGSLQHGATDRV